MFQIQSFTCEGLREHLVTDCAAPTFAYFVSSDRAGASVQSAELTVNGWTIRNPDQCGTRYAGQPLKPFTRIPRRLPSRQTAAKQILPA